MGKLVIRTAEKKPLTKKQLAFNKLTAQIEKLHREIANLRAGYDAALVKFNTVLPPLKAERARRLRELFEVLWNIYREAKLSKPDQRHLKTVLRAQLQELLDLIAGQPDAELANIFKQLEGESFEQMKKREEKEANEEIFDILRAMNIPVKKADLQDKEKLQAKLEEARTRMMEQEEQEALRRAEKRSKKPKSGTATAKEELRKAGEELKQKNIVTIYRQLAKLFHPDLEQDEEKKKEKEVLMKQLTLAYEAKNMHELLSLELKWIHRENAHLDTLSEEKLAIYLTILKDQQRQLSQEKESLNFHPRYFEMFSEVNPFTMDTLKAVDEVKQRMQQDIAMLIKDAEVFGAAQGLGEVRKMVRAAAKASKQDEDEELFNTLLRGY